MISEQYVYVPNHDSSNNGQIIVPGPGLLILFTFVTKQSWTHGLSMLPTVPSLSALIPVLWCQHRRISWLDSRPPSPDSLVTGTSAGLDAISATQWLARLNLVTASAHGHGQGRHNQRIFA